MSNVLTKDISKRLYYFGAMGNLNIPPGCINARLTASMTIDHKDYISYVKSALDAADIGNNLSTVERAGFGTQVKVMSKTHDILRRIHNRVYVCGHKAFDTHMLSMLDAESLAIMMMAIGDNLKLYRDPYGFHLNCYSYGDQYLLKLKLKEVFGLESNIRQTKNTEKRYYRLCIARNCSEQLKEIIEPFVLPSFREKLL